MVWAPRPPAFDPAIKGEWGVDAMGGYWYIVHRHTLKAVKVGKVGSRGVNYFDRAITLAEHRNRKLSKETPL